VLAELGSAAGVAEVVVLATCTRTEVYASTTGDGPGAEDAALASVKAWFAARLGVDAAAGGALHEARGPDVARHLFEVTAGLRSPVLGDRDVLGQVRSAWLAATAADAAGPTLGLLFRHAIVAARRVQAETTLGGARDSVPAAVVEALGSRLRGAGADGGTPPLVVVVGAGAMGSGIATGLQERGSCRVVVANRDLGRGRRLAAGIGATAIPLDALPDAAVEADAVAVAVGPGRPVLDLVTLAGVRLRRQARRAAPLVVVDVGMPRGVDPAAARLDGVELLGLKDLRRLASSARPGREDDRRQAETVLAEEHDRYERSARCQHAAPVLAALHSWGESVRAEELARAGSRLGGLTPEQVGVVETMTRRLVGKLLHPPTACLRDAAGTPEGEWLAELAHELFALDPAARVKAARP
ncbi:MAG TPA: NAD(P)-binding domain-containing protein, partial [Acidimicrobiales bacterium]|nr:NAD(P)-binding domain-containing protein [Acidimicrobiales bacterium]